MHNYNGLPSTRLHNYIDYTVPKEFSKIKMGRVGALKDGKDFETNTPRNKQITQSMWSDKIHNRGVRIMPWILLTGLNFEHAPMYMARTSEVALMELWSKPLKKKRKTTIEQRLEHRDLQQDAPSSARKNTPLSVKNASNEE